MIALNTTISKNLEYPLLPLTLSLQDCTHIIAPVIATDLTHTVILLPIPTTVRHTPV